MAENSKAAQFRKLYAEDPTRNARELAELLGTTVENTRRIGWRAGIKLARAPRAGAYARPRTASPVVAQLFNVIRSRGVFIEAAAAGIGMTRVGLAYWKSGARTPPITQVEALAQSLGYRLVLEEIEK